MRYSWTAIIFSLLFLHAAYAQSSFDNVTYAPGGSGYLPLNPASGIPTSGKLNSQADIITVGLPNPQGLLYGGQVPLSSFASANDLSLTNQNLTLLNQNVNQAVRRANSHASQGVAATSSITIVPPNPGDRFSVSFGGGGYGDEAGGGVSFAFRPPEAQNVMVFAGYARTTDANLVKGGVSFSFD